MIMNGLMRKISYEKYDEQKKSMLVPIMMCEIPMVKLNLNGIREYAPKRCLETILRMKKMMFIAK